jgi:hypothetical protein
MSPVVGSPPWTPEEDKRLRALVLLSQKVAFWELGILDNFGRFVFRHEELRWITQ